MLMSAYITEVVSDLHTSMHVCMHICMYVPVYVLLDCMAAADPRQGPPQSLRSRGDAGDDGRKLEIWNMRPRPQLEGASLKDSNHVDRDLDDPLSGN